MNQWPNTLAEASQRIRDKMLSPVELTRFILQQIEKIDPQVNAYITVMAEQAMAQAAIAEQEIIDGHWRGPLHGIPIAVKDIIDTAGTLTSCHSAVCQDRIPPQDATVVARLKVAGAIVIGKTATWEFAIGGTSFDLPWPPARNPWDLRRDPAGSSSGSAAAVAAGLCLGALGTDTGGSIRSPSAWCGIAGFKPTYGLVSRRGVVPLSFSQDNVGPMCWTVEDCALLLQGMAGYDAADPGSASPTEAVDYAQDIKRDIKGLRIGVVRRFFEEDSPADAEALVAFEDALRFYRERGCTIRDVELHPLQRYLDVSNLIERAEAFSIHRETLTKHPEQYGSLARKRIGSGAFIESSDYLTALRWRRQLIEHANNVMADVDVLMTPTRGTVAMPIGEYDTLRGGKIYTRPFNLLGFPALSLCNGYSSAGLPLAMQIVARPFDDATALQMGYAFEQDTCYRHTRPTLCK